MDVEGQSRPGVELARGHGGSARANVPDILVQSLLREHHVLVPTPWGSGASIAPERLGTRQSDVPCHPQAAELWVTPKIMFLSVQKSILCKKKKKKKKSSSLSE